ncbi:MAG: thioredoxin family protein, partial [Desulfovibrionales bacterium]|nr:thioredoxin family protein [Desulfovibrionales bacterium]
MERYNLRRLGGCLIILAILVGAFSPVHAAESATVTGGSNTIQWEKYAPGLSRALSEKKHVFIYFNAPWCTYCKKLKSTTFKDENVLAYLDENFVSIWVNTDENPRLAKQWKVNGLPTLWFLDALGQRISHLPGYVGPGQFIH